MSKGDDLVRLRHMLDHAREAASRVSKQVQAESSQIAWAQIVGMRNRLIHGYDFVDTEILWQTLQEDLPELIRA